MRCTKQTLEQFMEDCIKLEKKYDKQNLPPFKAHWVFYHIYKDYKKHENKNK